MAQITDNPARLIIIMSDRSPAHSGIAGIGAVVATQLAIDGFGEGLRAGRSRPAAARHPSSAMSEPRLDPPASFLSAIEIG
jgi:hypothetical protein